MNSLKVNSRGWLLWLSPFALLVLLLGWETDWGDGLHRLPPSGDSAPPGAVNVAVLPEYQPQGTPETSRDMVDRTLFNPTRRPAPTAVVEAAKPRIQRGQFTLTGTIVVEGKAYAFLRETNGGKARRVAQGDSINGMEVAEVKPDRIRLTMGDESEELALKLAVGPRVTVQPPVAAGIPVRGMPGAVVAGSSPAGAQAAAPVRDVSEVLAERRRLAREAEAAAAGRPPGSPLAAPGQPAGLPAPAGTSMQSAAPPAAAAPGAPDPQWQSVYQRYQQPRR